MILEDRFIVILIHNGSLFKWLLSFSE